MHFITLFHIVLCVRCYIKEEAGRREKNKELGEPQKDSPIVQLPTVGNLASFAAVNGEEWHWTKLNDDDDDDHR